MNSPYSSMRMDLDAEHLLKCNFNNSVADHRCLKGEAICKFPKQNQSALSELSF